MVESVDTSCSGEATNPTGVATNATIVMFGHINFKNTDLENSQLEEGITYFCGIVLLQTMYHLVAIYLKRTNYK